MSSPLAAGRAGPVDGVVGVEVTIDGMLVIADRLHLIEFPTALGIRPNIPQDDLRKLVWDQVQRDLTAQGLISRPWSLLLWVRLDPRRHRAIPVARPRSAVRVHGRASGGARP